MTAFIFPGQGSQYIGMGLDFYQKFPLAKRVFEEASDTLGIDMPKLCFEVDEKELSLTANAQPAILTASIAFLRILQDEIDISPDFLAGHSLGEYTALVAAKAIDFKDAVYIVRRRGEFMQDSVPVGVGSMAAIIGISASEIKNVCDDLSNDNSIVSPANFNSPQQTVISGHLEAVEKASALFKEAGAKRVVPLAVSAPFHCLLMNPAAQKLKTVLEDIEIRDVSVPIVTNVTATSNSDSSKIKQLLVQQVVSPVRWSESIKYLKNQNVNTFIEIGPGNVLSRLIKRTVSEVNIINLEKPVQLNHINENGTKK